MPVKFGPSSKKFVKGKKNNFDYDHEYIKIKTDEFLFEYINNYTSKPKVRRKCIVELQRRGHRLVRVPRKFEDAE